MGGPNRGVGRVRSATAPSLDQFGDAVRASQDPRGGALDEVGVGIGPSGDVADAVGAGVETGQGA